MVALTISLFLCLASSPAWSLSADIASLVSPYVTAQQTNTAIEGELSAYLDDDDIASAEAFVLDLAERGEIDEADKRALLDHIWRTKTERTLEYARKIREAIRDSDLDTMRAYNARMQRLMGSEPAQAGLGDDEAATEPAQAGLRNGGADELAPDAEGADADEAEGVELVALQQDEPEPIEPEDGIDETIADLVRRGEAAIASYNLTVARPDKDSALGMVDQLMALGDDGEAPGQALAEKIIERYRQLIERDIGRDRLDKAASFAERMGEVAEHARLPRDEADAIGERIRQNLANDAEHARLVSETEQRLYQGRLVGPGDEHALASAAAALKLGIDPETAGRLLDDVVLRQQAIADRLADEGALRDAARALETLADALLAANVGQIERIAEFRVRAAALFRQANRLDSERERQAAARARAASEAESSSNPFTFINPF